LLVWDKNFTSAMAEPKVDNHVINEKSSDLIKIISTKPKVARVEGKKLLFCCLDSCINFIIVSYKF